MENEKKISEAARELARKGAAKGGIARAKSLTPDQRKEIARKAVEARWDKATKKNTSRNLPKATNSGVLTLGNFEIPCHVLENGERIISTRGIMKSLGRTWRGRKYTGTKYPVFLEAKNLKPFISNELETVLTPIEFAPRTGYTSEGYKGEVLPLICETYLQARDADALTQSQFNIAKNCEILIRGLSRVGIIALIDEATGYQYERDRNELNQLLAIYLSEERLKWAKTFPDEFYRQIYRLKNWSFPGTGTKRTPLIGKITNDIVYEKLPPGVLPKLRELNPKIENTHRRRWKFFQFLSEDIGQPDLRDHLLQLITIMKAAKSWQSFEKLLERVFPARNPKPKQMGLFPDDSDD